MDEILAKSLEYFDQNAWKGMALLFAVAIVVLARELKVAYDKMLSGAVDSKKELVDLVRTCVVAIEASTEMDKSVKSALETNKKLESLYDYVRFARGRGAEDGGQ